MQEVSPPVVAANIAQAPVTPPTPVQSAPNATILTHSLFICPSCHIEVKAGDYFCFNCGHNLKPRPLSTSIIKQLMLYIGSLLLPPFGLIWGWPYLREPTVKAKMIGIITIFLTVASLVGTTYYALQFAEWINEQVNNQMNVLQGFNKSF